MFSTSSSSRIAIVGSGPCGLTAATELVSAPVEQRPEIHIFERRAGLGRKLLVAGSSGLNISNGNPVEIFAEHYTGFDRRFWRSLLEDFGPREWIAFIEKKLGLETFLGTSDRYFVREMKASGLLKRWTALLAEAGVHFHPATELSGFTPSLSGIELRFDAKPAQTFDRVVFALGGGSWEERPPRWVDAFREAGIRVRDFTPANVGYEVAWNEGFLGEAEGKPLKKIRLETAKGKKDGELVVTKYGLEGTPIYFFGTPGKAFLDLRPDLSLDQVIEKLERVKENLAPIRRAKQKLELCEASQALLFHHLSAEDRGDIRRLAEKVKRFPLELLRPRPLEEAISSKGGVEISELKDSLELKRFPGIYCGGEMIDWDAPTGGFLIQAAVSMGARIGKELRS